ncbi:unnamed protein product [Rotaria socialis]|uniref:Uncharacterized protein n=1 Tax=Rotaria socialis TaxID=392032 RepID=A0A818F338_9BILA|nr:unnamed protein product [Rotaria socialis]
MSCCILQVPLNYAQTNQSSISISMLLLSPPNQKNNSLFVLSQGPGESGLGLVSIIDQLIPVEYGITIIFPDHRGTEYLKNRCTIEGLNQFSMTYAARNLAILIEAFQLIGRISILGVSYGTYWLNRFLTIYPNLVQPPVMNSPLKPLLHSFTMYNIRAASMTSQFLPYCHYQIECIKYFPVDRPGVMLYKILQDIDSNNQLYFFFQAQGLSSSSSDPLATDVNTPVLNTDVLYYYIAFSELWLYFNQSDIDQQALNTFQNATIIAPNLRSDLIALRDA